MADFAFKPPRTSKAKERDELRGHDIAASGASRQEYQNRENAMDKLRGTDDDLPNPHTADGFNKLRKLQTAAAILNRRRGG